MPRGLLIKNQMERYTFALFRNDKNMQDITIHLSSDKKSAVQGIGCVKIKSWFLIGFSSTGNRASSSFSVRSYQSSIIFYIQGFLRNLSSMA